MRICHICKDLWFLVLVLALAFSTPVLAQQSLQVTGQGQSVSGFGSAAFGVSVDATVDIQGFVLALGSDEIGRAHV